MTWAALPRRPAPKGQPLPANSHILGARNGARCAPLISGARPLQYVAPWRTGWDHLRQATGRQGLSECAGPGTLPWTTSQETGLEPPETPAVAAQQTDIQELKVPTREERLPCPRAGAQAGMGGPMGAAMLLTRVFPGTT